MLARHFGTIEALRGTAKTANEPDSEARKTLTAIDGIGPSDLGIAALVRRIEAGGVREVILGLNATVDGQTTAHYIADQLAGKGVDVTRLAHGMPVGGELDHLDDGTLAAALRSRRGV